MDNIRVIKTGINVSKILNQLKQYPEDWEHQKGLDGVQSLVDRGFDDLPAGVLQLVIGGVMNVEDFIGDSEICIPTPADVQKYGSDAADIARARNLNQSALQAAQ